MGKDAVEGNLRQRLIALERRISALERQQQDVGQLSELSSDMGLVTAGEFRAGNGVEPGEGFSGVRMTADGVNGYANDVLQAGLSATDGKIIFGVDNEMGANGITLASPGSYVARNSIKFANGGNQTSELYNYISSVINSLNIIVDPIADKPSALILESDSPSTYLAQVLLYAKGQTVEARLSVEADSNGLTAIKLNSDSADVDTIIYSDTGAVLTVDAGDNDVDIATKLNMGDTGAITGGSESLADDTVVSFTPVIDKGLIIVYVGAADEQAMVIYNTSTPGTWGMLLGADMVITTGALTDGTTDGTDAKWNISCHTDGKIYIKNRIGSTKVVRWNLFGGV